MRGGAQEQAGDVVLTAATLSDLDQVGACRLEGGVGKRERNFILQQIAGQPVGREEQACTRLQFYGKEVGLYFRCCLWHG